MRGTFILRVVAFFCIAAYVSLALPSHVTASFVVHEEHHVAPQGLWTKGPRLDGGMDVPVRIALTQNNLHNRNRLLSKVSEPDSFSYGKQYTEQQVNDLFAPLPETTTTVLTWLQNAGIDRHRILQSHNRQWLKFMSNVTELESLLQAEYYSYQHASTGSLSIGCQTYKLPAFVLPHVDFVVPGAKHLKVTGPHDRLRNFHRIVNDLEAYVGPTEPTFKPLPLPLSEIAAHGGLAHCQQAVTPSCISRLYGVNASSTAIEGNELGIFETANDVYSQPDLDAFFNLFDRAIPNSTHPKLNSINGAVAPYPIPSAGGESSLDFQISYPIIYPQKTVLYQVNSTVDQSLGQRTAFDAFLDAVDGSYCFPEPGSSASTIRQKCGIYEPTNVVSLSWGSYEYEYPVKYQKRMCNEFLKLGLRGVSIVFAAGDSGVAARSAQAGNSNGCLGRNATIFNPGFPANCPWVTSVGATWIPPASEDMKEIAVGKFGSGGGFSNIYSRPDYQASSVSGYFNASNISYPFYETANNESIGANGGIYNRAGRGYPDVAGLGDNIVVSTAGNFSLMHGTSASAPLFAALLTRINEERLSAGKGTVGFVNPVLYRNPQVLSDITVGNNSGCGTPGFFAAKGWDPVSGLGTPKYAEMLDLFMKLP